jgi:TfoX/Sxy family transcriptional regulator of competence genes
MASHQSTVDYIVEQIAKSGAVYTRKMFGEYALYCDTKVVALVCDDQLFVKPTSAGKVFIGNVVEAAPYAGAKPYFLISGEYWDDSQWLAKLIKISADELPFPKQKKPAERKSN